VIVVRSFGHRVIFARGGIPVDPRLPGLPALDR
jgi:hypothetical protein